MVQALPPERQNACETRAVAWGRGLRVWGLLRPFLGHGRRADTASLVEVDEGRNRGAMLEAASVRALVCGRSGELRCVRHCARPRVLLALVTDSRLVAHSLRRPAPSLAQPPAQDVSPAVSVPGGTPLRRLFDRPVVGNVPVIVLLLRVLLLQRAVLA